MNVTIESPIALPPLNAKQVWVLDIASTLSRSNWTREDILVRLRYLAAKWNLPMGEACMWCRVAITGTTVSEPVDELLSGVDKDRALEAILKLAEWKP